MVRVTDLFKGESGYLILRSQIFLGQSARLKVKERTGRHMRKAKWLTGRPCWVGRQQGSVTYQGDPAPAGSSPPPPKTPCLHHLPWGFPFVWTPRLLKSLICLTCDSQNVSSVFAVSLQLDFPFPRGRPCSEIIHQFRSTGTVLKARNWLRAECCLDGKDSYDTWGCQRLTLGGRFPVGLFYCMWRPPWM